ncbi:MAG: transposase [Candidatus Methanomethylophilaceae archaeon]
MLKDIRVDRGTHEFPSILPVTGLYFALLEESGIMDVIRDAIKIAEDKMRAEKKVVRVRNLTTEMALKAFTGTYFSNGQRYPLYEIKNYYASAPTKLIFGPYVEPSTLSDTNIAGRMDDMAYINFDELIERIGDQLEKHFGIESKDYFLDQTNVYFYGRAKDDKTGKATMMKRSAKCKSGKKDLIHKEISSCCTRNGTIIHGKPFDGATSDTEMDAATIDSIIDRLDKYSTISGDCKFCDFDIIRKLDQKGVCFVTKVPGSFSNNLKRTVVESARSGLMDASPKYKGRLVYETHSPICNSEGEMYGDLRLIAYILPGGKKRARRFLETKGLNDFTKALKRVWHMRFKSREDAVEAVFQAFDEAEEPIYNAVVEYDIDNRKKGDEPKWMVRIKNVLVDESKIDEAAERYSIQVLITNARLTKKDSEAPIEGLTTDSVVNRYLTQAVIEKRFRMMKTCHGIGHIFIHTPIRQDVMIRLDIITTSIQSVMDEVMKRKRPVKGRNITVEMLSDKLIGSRLAIDQPNGRIFMSGDQESKDLFFEAVDRLGVNLGYAFPLA